MKYKKLIWIILLIIGCFPFFLTLIYGIDSAINGFYGTCFCGEYYGFKAFKDSVILVSSKIYPVYILAVCIIVLSIIKLRKI